MAQSFYPIDAQGLSQDLFEQIQFQEKIPINLQLCNAFKDHAANNDKQNPAITNEYKRSYADNRKEIHLKKILRVCRYQRIKTFLHMIFQIINIVFILFGKFSVKPEKYLFSTSKDKILF